MDTESIMDILPSGILIQDPDGNIKYANMAAAKLFGFTSPRSLYGKDSKELLHSYVVLDSEGNEIPAYKLPGYIATKTKSQSSAIVRYRKHTEANDRWTLDIATPFYKKNVFVGTVITLIDYTAHEKDKRIHKQVQERENTLRLALDVGHMGIWDWDITRNSFSWSDGTRPSYDLGRGNHVGSFQQFLNHIFPKDRDMVKRIILKAKKNRGSFDAEFRISRPDNSVRWMYKRGEVLYDGKGNVVRMIGVGIDITKRKETEFELLQSQSKFKAIFDSVSDAMMITDNTLHIIESNAAAARMFSRPLKSLLNQSLLELLDEEAKKTFLEKWNKATRAGTIHSELAISTKFTDKLYLEYSINKRFLNETNLLVFHDITNRVTEEQRREHLLGLASHELRTPLASMKAFIAILERKLIKANQSGMIEYLSKIDEKTNAITRLVRDLLDVSRIRDNRFELFYEVFDFDSFLKDLLADIQLTVPTHRIKTYGKTHSTMVADKQRISQVVTNIVKNAARYSPNADKIVIRVQKKSNRVLISIQDFGIGISKNDYKNIFRLFYKANTEDRTRVYGIGVGLYIAKTIVEQHGGSLWVTSEVNSGSIFYVSLPLRFRKKEKHIIADYV